MIKIPKTDCIDDFEGRFLHSLIIIIIIIIIIKCKDNKTNNGEDDNDQTHTQKTKWIYSVAP